MWSATSPGYYRGRLEIRFILKKFLLNGLLKLKIAPNTSITESMVWGILKVISLS